MNLDTARSVYGWWAARLALLPAGENLWADCPLWEDLDDGHRDAWMVAVDRAQHAQLTRIEQKLDRLTHLMEAHMSRTDDELDALDAAVTALDADEQRELADLRALQTAGTGLSDDEAARLAALTARVQADDAAINAADPAPAPPAGDTLPPVDGTPVDEPADATAGE